MLISRVYYFLVRAYLLFKGKLYYYHLKLMGAHIHKSVRIYGRVVFYGNPKNLYIGKRVRLNDGVVLNARNKLIIDDDVTLSTNVQVHTAKLNLDDFSKFVRHKHTSAPIYIGKHTWVASNVVIGPGVSIGRNCVIGANSFVNKSLPDNVLAGGNPAKILKVLWK